MHDHASRVLLPRPPAPFARCLIITTVISLLNRMLSMSCVNFQRFHHNPAYNLFFVPLTTHIQPCTINPRSCALSAAPGFKILACKSNINRLQTHNESSTKFALNTDLRFGTQDSILRSIL